MANKNVLMGDYFQGYYVGGRNERGNGRKR